VTRAKRGICCRLCVFLSHSGIVSKWLNVGPLQIMPHDSVDRSGTLVYTDKHVAQSLCHTAELLVNFGCLIHISGKAQARALKLCTKGDYIKSGQRDGKSPLKGALFCSHDPFCMCNCGLKKKFCHRTLLAWINKTDYVFVSPSTVDAIAVIN